MAKTESNMLPLGTIAPNFSLLDVVSNEIFSLDPHLQFAATVIMFICNHCPYVKHVNPELTRLSNDYIPKNVRFIAINSNDIEAYPADSPELMITLAQEQHFPFPYLFDGTQEVARAYQAACTPDFFVFNSALQLEYRGQLDASRPGNSVPLSGSSIRQALDQILANKPVTIAQTPSIGCNIKWK